MKQTTKLNQSEGTIVIGDLSLNLSLVLVILGFFIPLLFSSPQWLIGTIVNTLLFISAERLSLKKQLPLIIFPSLGALAHGVVFGPLTIFLLYFLPFIWLGNTILVKVMSFKLINKWPFVCRLIIASFLKAGFLFFSAYFYISFHFVPSVFLVSMGFIQLVTAISGGIIVYFMLSKNLI